MLICTDADYRTAMTIVECLLSHTRRVYEVLVKEMADPFGQSACKVSPAVRRIYEALPDKGQFTMEDVRRIMTEKRMSLSNSGRTIGQMESKFNLIRRVSRGVYEKLTSAA